MRAFTTLFFLCMGCVKDRTGQSWVSAMRMDIERSKTQLETIEDEVKRINARVGDLESLTKSRGKSDIMKMESMEELRIEVANLRNDIEILTRDYTKTAKQVGVQGEDAQFRLQWLEERARQLEEQLGFSKPSPPGSTASVDAQPKSETETPSNVNSKTTDQTNQPAASSSVDPKRPSDAVEKANSSAPNTAESRTVDEPEKLLSLAADHLRGARARAAEAVLNRFLQKYPSHAKAGEAKYRLAEAAFNSEQYKSAANRFQAVIDHNDKGYWAPWAMLRQGECFEKLDRSKSARFFYDDVIRIHPDSDAAKEAKDKLSKPPFSE